MKSFMKKSAIAEIVLSVIFSAGWAQQFDYAAYTQTTFHNIITQEQNQSYDQTKPPKVADFIQLECKVSKYRISCCYSNALRPISEKKKDLIKQWVEILEINPALASLYRHEILVNDGSGDRWIPMQEQLFPYINQELVKNDTIELFIVFIGKVDSELVFIATEFEKPIPTVQDSTWMAAFTRKDP